MTRVLLVDDDRRITVMLSRMLLSAGEYSVRIENDSRQVVAVAEEFQPDVVVMDVDMPHMDGGDVAYAMGSRESTHKIPIIFLTSLFTRAEAQKGQEAASNQRVLPKPLAKNDLIRALSAALVLEPALP